MSDTWVTLSKEGPLGIITLDRPPANSYDLHFLKNLNTAIDGVGTDNNIKAALLISASEKFFCAGADIKISLGNTLEAHTRMINFAHQTLSKMARIPKVFIAVINGHALGGGLEIALACDLRLAGNGEFLLGLSESKLGTLPGNGGTQRLPRLIGAGPALELMLTGRSVGPQQALQLGIVNHLFPAESLLDEAKEYALTLANGPTKALAHIKRCVYEGLEKPLADGLALERESSIVLFTTKDAREGLNAFVEKRAPEFKGK